MSSNRFVGIAYWSVTTSVSDWLARALDLLMPLERAGIAVIGFDCLPVGNQLSVRAGVKPVQIRRLESGAPTGA